MNGNYSVFDLDKFKNAEHFIENYCRFQLAVHSIEQCSKYFVCIEGTTHSSICAKDFE